MIGLHPYFCAFLWHEKACLMESGFIYKHSTFGTLCHGAKTLRLEIFKSNSCKNVDAVEVIISSCSGVCLAKARSSLAVCLWESANSEKVELFVIGSWYSFA